ncbi:menaquinone biosynthesis protein [Cohnella nanjingensis]|uniref:Chorismate dehydratase n=1 Tax=Cohnella nanjingensis TaxID=1387779 RepID=A0A7X0RUX0_9BACL|nr:menaquinone biosynthesis protein [Cohnella nanjingensis]MBB6674142.1 menaquinone biosynthesis protein [Cohnella nanjingensis]
MRTDGTGPIRIGRIEYTNVWPVFHHFDPTRLDVEAEIVQDVPAALNRKLREGEIDMAAISSFAYGQSCDDYLLLPNLSVSAKERVQSILLFVKTPLEQALNGRIALTTTSATSVNLLKIIAEKFYGAHPTYDTVEPCLDTMLEQADAAMLIGDHAIRASWREHGCQVLDLGELWHRYTGLGMTFAVWAVRRETAAARPEAVREIFEALTASKRRALDDLRPVVAHAERQIGGTAAYWDAYFRGLTYDFGAAEREGLSLYFRYAHELGFLASPVGISEWRASGSRERAAADAIGAHSVPKVNL